MKGDFEVPEDVRALMLEHLESYEHLQVLLLLSRERDVIWTAEAVTSRLNIPAALAATTLASLRNGGLICTPEDATEPQYRYAPLGPTLQRTVDRLAFAYEMHSIPIIKLMNANAIERLRKASLRTFADAFILRKDKEDG